MNSTSASIMKSELKKPISETRKIRKPLMEKKRRARINDSLEALKQILLESKTTLKESTDKKNGQRTTKLEKADILEMTVRYVQYLKTKLGQCEVKQEMSDKSELKGLTLIPTKLNNGDIVFVVPSNTKKFVKMGEAVWRPW